MAFRIPKEEYINRTFRLRKELVDRMETICNEKNISLNKLTVLCIEYALDNLEEEPPATPPEPLVSPLCKAFPTPLDDKNLYEK